MFTKDELCLLEAAVRHFLIDVNHWEARECSLIKLLTKLKEVSK